MQQPGGTPAGMKPHNGTMILVFGILGLLMCTIFGIIAWVMGNRDLKEMDAGVMDPAGRDNTKTGKILGMVGTIIAIVGVGLTILISIFMLIFGLAAAGSSGM